MIEAAENPGTAKLHALRSALAFDRDRLFARDPSVGYRHHTGRTPFEMLFATGADSALELERSTEAMMKKRNLPAQLGTVGSTEVGPVPGSVPDDWYSPARASLSQGRAQLEKLGAIKHCEVLCSIMHAI